ncbi:MAG: RagB/SusD family nutrient uptake outer membrane protein [Cyclobacteriaceae bacterium]|nr:RagB/SusD family nutrient uptake outer membrane protein [Cyclobacteriaceae bacterium]MCH8516399.1 RagB/SusD family nutrient uptake outer membrane protein [Cyclobacteriaceae bacterium]
MNHKILYNILIFGFLFFGMWSCTIDEQVDPNNPDLESLINNPTVIGLNNVVIGIEAGSRNGYQQLVTAPGTIARELYLFDADPRNTQDLLGADGMQLDNNTFYITAPYNSRYRVVRNCNILLEAIQNELTLSETEKNGYTAFAKTFKAYMFLQVLNLLDENGIRVDVEDPDDLGPFVSREQAFQRISQLLDEAATELNNAGDNFRFGLSNGFIGFDSPATFRQFNRAMAARVHLYRENYAEAAQALAESFFDINGDLSTAVQHIFSTASGDILNPVFRIPNQSGNQIILHDRYIENLQDGDTRLDLKTRLRVDPSSARGLNGQRETALYDGPTAPIDIIRNEELILIDAEIKWAQGNYAEAVASLNVIRNAFGLPDYAGELNEGEVFDELLYNREYSLWCEGHLMIDYRRFGLLNDDFLPIDREGDIIHLRFPIPIVDLVI